MEDIRNRLLYSRCDDEPSVYGFHAFQEALDTAYELKDAGPEGIVVAYSMLNEHATAPQTTYQAIRREFLTGEYFRYLDQLDTTHDRIGPRQDALGRAADHFEQGARLAKSVHDWALVEQLKTLERAVCLGSKLSRKRFRRAYAAAREALAAWHKLPVWDDTLFRLHHFELTDYLAGIAEAVGEDREAFEALELAGFILSLVQDRPDLDALAFKRFLLYLDWDWATLYWSLGFDRLAFRHVRLARHHSRDGLSAINQVRLPHMIATIALDCAENSQTLNISGYSRERLLALADAALDDAFAHWEACNDRAGYALTLLAEAKWLGLKNRTHGRSEKIEKARAMAHEVNDLGLLAKVDIALGDEFALKRQTQPARECYLKAERRMTDVGFEEIARVARRRLERLPQPRRSTRQRQLLPDISQFAGDYSPN